MLTDEQNSNRMWLAQEMMIQGGVHILNYNGFPICALFSLFLSHLKRFREKKLQH